jgi:outer membrane lipoprotein SlyB
MNKGARVVRFLILNLILVVIGGCAPVNDGIGRYRVESVGNAHRSVEAVVLASKPVIILEQISGAGGAIGGALAAENSDNAAVIIAGIVAGAIIGNSAEVSGKTYGGHEYVIEKKRGVLLTVAQIDASSNVFSANDKVILVYGHPHRLIEDPR